MRWLLLGDLPDLARDVVGTFARLKDRHGARAPFYMGSEKGVVLSDPEDVRRLLLAPESVARKSRYTKMMSAVFGESVLIAEGAVWERQRAYLNPLFSPKSVRAYAPLILRETELLLGSLKSAKDGALMFNACADSKRLIQNIMGSILFGDLFPRDRLDAVIEDLQTVNDTLFASFITQSVLKGPLAYLPTPASIKLKRATRRIGAFIDDLITTQIADDHPSIAAAIIKAVPEGEGRAAEIRDQITVLFYAGQDTTARALAWTLYFLSRHPEWIGRIRAEAAALSAADATTLDTKQFPVTLSVVRESLRLRPVAYAIDRQIWEPEAVGFDVDVGMIAPVAVSNVHASAEHWELPNTFAPERFAPEAVAGRHPCAYVPFGHGKRKCVGAALAELELVLIVAEICRRHGISADDGEFDGEAKAAVTLAPAREIPLTLLRND